MSQYCMDLGEESAVGTQNEAELSHHSAFRVCHSAFIIRICGPM